MHDLYDWTADIVLPLLTGGGVVVVGVAALATARRSNDLAGALLKHTQGQDALAARRAFADRLRRFSEILLAQRVAGTASIPDLNVAGEHTALLSAAMTLGQPHAVDLVTKVAAAAKDHWGNGSVPAQMHLARTVIDAQIDTWTSDPGGFHERWRSVS